MCRYYFIFIIYLQIIYTSYNFLIFFCLVQGNGAVALAMINLSNSTTYQITIPSVPTVPRGEWHITSPSLLSTEYYVNGEVLVANEDGSIPEWIDVTITDPDKPIYIEPLSIQFLVLSNAKASACV